MCVKVSVRVCVCACVCMCESVRACIAERKREVGGVGCGSWGSKLRNRALSSLSPQLQACGHCVFEREREREGERERE